MSADRGWPVDRDEIMRLRDGLDAARVAMEGMGQAVSRAFGKQVALHEAPFVEECPLGDMDDREFRLGTSYELVAHFLGHELNPVRMMCSCGLREEDLWESKGMDLFKHLREVGSTALDELAAFEGELRGGTENMSVRPGHVRGQDQP